VYSRLLPFAENANENMEDIRVMPHVGEILVMFRKWKGLPQEPWLLCSTLGKDILSYNAWLFSQAYWMLDNIPLGMLCLVNPKLLCHQTYDRSLVALG
jgi:hypothetical protein